MKSNVFNQFLFRALTIAILSLGFVQPSTAEIIGTQQMIDFETRQEALSNIAGLLKRQDVAEQLIEFGVDPDTVLSRVNNMTSAELVSLEGHLDRHIAGGDVVGTIGIVFVVLIILELVGVTDIFKSM